MTHEEKVKRYATIKHTVAIVDIIYMLCLLTAFQLTGASGALRELCKSFAQHQTLVVLGYSLMMLVAYFILNLPLSFYSSYIVEHRFELSNQRFPQWMGDYVKASVLGAIVFTVLIEGFSYFLRHFPDAWWWMCSIFWIFLSVVIARIFPVIVIPLFYKYKRIDNEDLRSRIMNLSQKMGVKVLDVFGIDFSKKTTKANAALVGLGGSKRVILADTLEGKFSHEEIEVILAHEFAHQRLRHLVKLVTLNAAVILAAFYLFYIFGPAIFGGFNIAISDIAGLPVWIFLFTLLQLLLTPVLNLISRVMEKNADRMAIEVTGRRQEFISMIEKLTDQNLGQRKPPLWVKIFFYDHPPTEERVALARKVSP